MSLPRTVGGPCPRCMAVFGSDRAGAPDGHLCRAQYMPSQITTIRERYEDAVSFCDWLGEPVKPAEEVTR